MSVGKFFSIPSVNSSFLLISRTIQKCSLSSISEQIKIFLSRENTLGISLSLGISA